MKKTFAKVTIVTFLSSLFCLGCMTTARFSDFPQTASRIDFERYSKEFKQEKSSFSNSKTNNEYYFESELKGEDEIVLSIKEAMKVNSYQVFFSNIEDKCIMGKRGMVANEWNSITAAYYQIDNENKKVKFYVNTKITQDITGGWAENRAKKVGKRIEENMKSI